VEDAEIRRKLTAGSAYADLPGHHVTVSQLVAYNMARFRKAAGLTQEELGERLGGWSAASVSAAERSWDGKRIRKFDADEIVNMATTLGIPVTALFLPPEDDGVEHRYLFHMLDRTGSEGGSVCHSMHDLFMYLMSEPTDDDSPVMNAYRQRYVGAVNAYLDSGGGEELIKYMEDLTTEERIVGRIARLRGQYDALRGMLTDIDQLQEALADHLMAVRGRPLGGDDRRTPERREWDAQMAKIMKELFGDTSFTLDQIKQAEQEANRRGIFPPPRERWFEPEDPDPS
jgi:transcriptional regulator with XRE-family HTH domain